MQRLPTVLVVSDGDTPYTDWLRSFCTVRRAYTGRQARDSLDRDVDAVVLDGPVLGFDTERLAAAARECGCRAITVTDARPDAVPDPVEPVPRSVSGTARRDALATLLPAAQPVGRRSESHGGGGANTPVSPRTADSMAAAVRKFLE
ncbi:MAG: hypothetical protein ABEH77_11040 [Halobacteriaceae archaeon]